MMGVMRSGIPQCQSKPYRRTIIEDVDCVAAQTNCFDEADNQICQVVKRLPKLFGIQSVRENKTWQVRSNDVIAVGKSGDQIAKHVRGRGEAM